jgi:hypothetical protein
LNIESVRDSYSSNSKGFNVGAGLNLGSDSKYTAKAEEGHNVVSNNAQAKLNQTVGLRTGDGLGSANANFGINNSNYQQKQAVVLIFNHKRYDYRALQAIKGNLNEAFCIVDFIHFSFIGLRCKK